MPKNYFRPKLLDFDRQRPKVKKAIKLRFSWYFVYEF